MVIYHLFKIHIVSAFIGTKKWFRVYWFFYKFFHQFHRYISKHFQFEKPPMAPFLSWKRIFQRSWFRYKATIACFWLPFPRFSRSWTILLSLFHINLTVLNHYFKQIQIDPFPNNFLDFMHQIESHLISFQSQLSLKCKAEKKCFEGRHK